MRLNLGLIHWAKTDNPFARLSSYASNSDYKNIQGFINPISGTRIEMVIDMRKCKSDVSL